MNEVIRTRPNKTFETHTVTADDDIAVEARKKCIAQKDAAVVITLRDGKVTGISFEGTEYTRGAR